MNATNPQNVTPNLDQQTFERNLPTRLGVMQGRLRAMATLGWDVNVLYIIDGDVDEMAQASARFGISGVGELLYQLKAFLTVYIEGGRVPEPADEAPLMELLEKLEEFVGENATTAPTVARPAHRELRVRLPEPEIDVSGLPSLSNILHFVCPPEAMTIGRAATIQKLPLPSPVPKPPKPAPVKTVERDPSEPDIGIVLAEDPFDIGEDHWVDEAVAHDEADPGDLPGFDADAQGLVDAPKATAAATATIDEPAQMPTAEELAVAELASMDLDSLELEDMALDSIDLGSDQTITGELSEASVIENQTLDDLPEPLELDMGQIDALLADDDVGLEDVIVEEPKAEVSASDEELDEISAEAERTLAAIHDRGRARIYVMQSGAADLKDVVGNLSVDHDVETFDDFDEFLEVLGAIGPHAVLIDEGSFDQAAEIGAIVRKLRSKTSLALPFVAIGAIDDLGVRLQLMRAGTDAVIPPKAGAQGICQRIRELLDVVPEEPYRVLIVEDDRTQALFAQSILGRAGLDVELERDPLQVPNRMADFAPDLVLMDLHMPGCDGMELTAIIRENERFVGIPIVFLSGEDDVETHFDALLAGGDDFLAKPIKPRHLISAVMSRVRRARATAEAAPTVAPETSGMVRKHVFLDTVTAAIDAWDPHDESATGGLIFIELDHPLELRQRIGLPGLDELSDHIGALLGGMLSKADQMARYTDQSYVIWVPEGSEAALERFARMTVETVAAQRFDLTRGSSVATVSAGIAMLGEEVEHANQLIDWAERACNEDHESAVSRIRLYRAPSAGDEDPETRELGELILEALDSDGLQLVYQPVASLQGEETEHYQCLLRLPHGDRVRAPLEVIAVAEKLGMMPEIDRWVLGKALRVLEQESSRPRPLRLFVNQSAEAIDSEVLADWLSERLTQRRVAGTGLIVEFKLREIAGALNEALATREALAPLRVRVCLSMFDGTESAFNALSHFRPDFVKLGARVAAELAEKGTLDGVVNRLHELNAKVIVPSVEEAQAAVQMWTAGIDFIQGNFVQPPASELNYQFANVL